MPTEKKVQGRVPGTPQRFADRAGGPTVYDGTAYQDGVALMEMLALLARRQQSPLIPLFLRCEHRTLVEGGQLGYDIGVVTPERTRHIEAKSAPTTDEVVELLARLCTVAPDVRLQLVHGKANSVTPALDHLLRNADEALDDDELLRIVAASGDAHRAHLLTSVPVTPAGPKALLAGMARPLFLAPAALDIQIEMQARLLAGDGAGELVRRLTAILTAAFRTRRTVPVEEVHGEMVDAGLIHPVVLVTPGADPILARAVGVLELCPVPLRESALSAGLGLPAGGARALLSELIGARIVHDDGEALFRARGSTPIARSMVGSAITEVLRVFVESPDPSHLVKIADVPNVLALANASLREDPWLVARAFHPYDKASKATGDLSCVYLLAKTALEGAAHVPSGKQDAELLWLRAHARICGTSWTLQRVEQQAEASVEMDAARAESEPYGHADNLAFVDKCQGRLRRLLAEERTAAGDHAGAATLYDESRELLDRAHDSFVAVLADPRYVERDYRDEPGECLALRARAGLSQGRLDEAERDAAAAHAELDGLGPKCKPWADTCLVDAELALVRVREGLPADDARALLTEQATRLRAVLGQFHEDAEQTEQVDVGANEIVARTLRVLGQLALETGDSARAAKLLHEAAEHFDRVDQHRQAYHCAAQAMELDGVVPADLLAALAAADAPDGCRVEATRLHLAEPMPNPPARYWQRLVQQGCLAAAAREHRWTDMAAV